MLLLKLLKMAHQLTEFILLKSPQSDFMFDLHCLLLGHQLSYCLFIIRFDFMYTLITILLQPGHLTLILYLKDSLLGQSFLQSRIYLTHLALSLYFCPFLCNLQIRDLFDFRLKVLLHSLHSFLSLSPYIFQLSLVFSFILFYLSFMHGFELVHHLKVIGVLALPSSNLRSAALWAWNSGIWGRCSCPPSRRSWSWAAQLVGKIGRTGCECWVLLCQSCLTSLNFTRYIQ